MFTIYGDSRSGNCHKVKLLCTLCDIPFLWQEIDVLSGETRHADFLAKNPNGRLPCLTYADGRTLWESNAILYRLAHATAYWPEDIDRQARVLQWMFFEQYSHEPYIAVCRFIKQIENTLMHRGDEYRQKYEQGLAALHIMEHHLATHNFFVGDKPSIADISLFAYTHVAHEGGFSLESYPHIEHWIARLTRDYGFIPMH